MIRRIRIRELHHHRPITAQLPIHPSNKPALLIPNEEIPLPAILHPPQQILPRSILVEDGQLRAIRRRPARDAEILLRGEVLDL